LTAEGVQEVLIPGHKELGFEGIAIPSGLYTKAMMGQKKRRHEKARFWMDHNAPQSICRAKKTLDDKTMVSI
jgi:hypothetical protein